MPKVKIACIGEAMIELSATTVPGEANIGIAGDVFNTAIYLRRELGDGYGVEFTSLLGQDRLSDDIERFLIQEGIGVGNLARIPGKLPGIYAISTDISGERSFHYWRNDSAARQLFAPNSPVAFDDLRNADVIYFSAITLAILSDSVRHGLLDWIAQWRTRGGRFAFDSNYRPTLWEDPVIARDVISRAWQLCDVAMPSLDDELAIFSETGQDEVLKRFSTYPNCQSALKRGSLGPHTINLPTREVEFQPAKNVVDTTSAGDGFNGALLAAMIRGRSHEEAMQAGHDLATAIVGYPGAILPRHLHPSLLLSGATRSC